MYKTPELRAQRYVKRLKVELTDLESGLGFQGYTTDVSTTGMFMTSNRIPALGARVRAIVHEADHSFAIETEVARVRKVPVELHKVKLPGCGLRFLRPSELVEEILHLQAVRESEQPAKSEALPQEPSLAATPEPTRLSATEPQTTPTAPEPLPEPVEPRVRGLDLFPFQFTDRKHFLEAFAKDLRHGGLFVPSLEPAEIDEVIAIEMSLPDDDVLRVRARVVHRVVPGASTGGFCGMGVEFVDREHTMDVLKTIADELSTAR